MQVQRIVFVTGMSGAGKATAVRALEDIGFFCIDNLPVPVVPRLLEVMGANAPGLQQVALVIDAREGVFLGDTPAVIQDARARGHRVDLLFLDASDEVLIRRFSETRRRHPLAPEGTVPEGISAERAVLAELRGMADLVIDSTQTTVHELRALLHERFGLESARAPSVTITSFGYRYGLPAQADLVFDVRFIPNPYFVPHLRALPGTDPAVSGWVLGQPLAQEFLQRLVDLLEFLLPRYRDEGKSYLTVAIGCTGGRHRSVALTEALARELSARQLPTRARHRDVDRE